MDFKKWRNELIRKLRPLFAVYAAAQHFGITVSTVSLNAQHLMDGSGQERQLSDAKIKEKIKQVESEILRRIPMPDLAKYKKAILGKMTTKNPESIHYFSGKTYLMPLLHHRLKQKTDFVDRETAMKLRLARYSSFNIDKNLVDRIDDIISKHGLRREELKE